MERGISFRPALFQDPSFHSTKPLNDCKGLNLLPKEQEDPLSFFYLPLLKQMTNNHIKSTNNQKPLNNTTTQYDSPAKQGANLKLCLKISGESDDRSKERKTEIEIYKNTASLYEQQGNYEKCLQNLLKTVQIIERNQSYDCEAIAELYSKASKISKFKEDWKNVVKYCEKVRALIERGEGINLLRQAECYGNLGLAYYQEKDHAKAHKYLKYAVDIFPNLSREETFLFVEDVTQSLGNICLAKGQYESGLYQYKTLLETRMKRLGLCHRDIAPAFLNIGEAYLRQGKYMDAMRYCKQSLKMAIKTGGKYDLSVSEVYSMIAKVYLKHRKCRDALKYYSKALKIVKKNIKKNGKGGDIEKRVELYKNIGQVFYELANFDACIKFFAKGLKIERNAVGLENSKNLDLYIKVAGLYELQGKNEKAFAYLIQAFALQKRFLGYNHLCTQATLLKLELLQSRSR